MSTDLAQDLRQKDQAIRAFLEIFEDAKNESQKSRSQNYQPNGLLEDKLIAIKDNMLWTDHVSSAASKMLENFQSPYTSTVVQKLIDAGAIIVGRTNMDEFAMGSSTESSAFNLTKNPVDHNYVPGGSSGGSAAAVAANMVWGALGSDTGGSIRQPAAFCGVVGFKPTYGTVSRYGLIAMGSSLDVIGPFSKTVKNARLLYEVIAGQDKMDSTSRNVLKTTEGLDLSKLTIGIPKEFFGDGLDNNIKQRINEVVNDLKEKGANIKNISLPNVGLSLAVYYVLMPVEVASNMARFDGIRYGFSIERLEKEFSLQDVYTKSRELGFGQEVKRRIMLGTYASSAGYVDQYYLKAQKVRQLIINEFQSAFSEVDLLITPTTPTPPFKFGEKTGDPLKMYLEDVYTVPANIAGLPALNVPVGKINHQDSNLPVGLQIMGPQLSDYKVLQLGEKIEDIYAKS
jgi:aspartyl-tRNA(Asn)/glutamyl-tRNA(Gln) amidotransferase subunit A